MFHNLNIHEVETVEEAIQAVKASSYQIIFMDVILGNQNGINCVKKIKNYASESRIILISAYPDKEFHRLGLAAGAAAFIDKKMLDSETLKQIISDTISSH
jgi:DNA-binding NarL/FixJ family response regulator